MENQFEIRFNFPLEHSQHTIPLQATVQLHHLDPYYVVDAFRFEGTNTSAKRLSLLPVVEIKRLKKENRSVWVHKDSERESALSQAIGKAIEEKSYFKGQ